MDSYSDSYKEAGVDITAGYKAVQLMKKSVDKTMTSGVVSGLGGFGGLFMPDISGMKAPVLVSGTDGVGTKLKIAFLLDKHDTVGIDCVAMCVNDIICAGAKPLFFLDYIACGKNFPEKIASIVSGVAEGCIMAGAALIGGETAEMPGFYPEDEYDLAGFSVGIADKEKIIDNTKMCAGDIMIALPSSGLHSNGFSLVRKVFDVEREGVLDKYHESLGTTLGQALIEPTRIYVSDIMALVSDINIKGISHITGGGFFENIPRSIPKGLTAKLNKASIVTPPVFSLLAATGKISEHDMYNTYNMGVGMAVTVAREDADKALDILKKNNEAAYIIGEIVAGDKLEIVS